MPFIGRERELRTLEQLYETGTFQTVSYTHLDVYKRQAVLAAGLALCAAVAVAL